MLGLGSPEASQPARLQAAFALMLAQHLLPGLRQPIQACDPVFTLADRSLLAALGWQVRSGCCCCCSSYGCSRAAQPTGCRRQSAGG